ncbi:MAG TPA: glycosyltransferase [Solirubrobacteraceae bacterium]|jgi:hypothetical protein|nr:glycosyltransferase [Solirubrobacteraceae bacterium]
MADAPHRPLRIAVVGVSEAATCGVRDHAALLSEALGARGVDCSTHWLTRSEHGLRGCRAEFRAWTAQLRAELERDRPDAILLHYSVFSYSYRGLPLFVASVLAALRASERPIVGLLHEIAYPWRIGGLRGAVWAFTQRTLSIELMRSCAAVVVTAPFRAEALRSNRLLPRCPIYLAPVFSNLPAPRALPGERTEGEHSVGLFGYAYEGAAASLVLDALRLLGERGLPARLVLLGAPGPDSAAAERWRTEAGARGVELSFSGVLSPAELSDALAACDALLHPERSGATSRKGTLTGSLASGRPVVALDGPLAWDELIAARAAEIAQADPRALADKLEPLLRDPAWREEVGARGAEFARSHMSVERSAEVVTEAIEQACAGRQAV